MFNTIKAVVRALVEPVLQLASKALNWYNNLHWGVKVGVGAAALTAAIGITALCGGAAAVGSLIAKVAIGTAISAATGALFGGISSAVRGGSFKEGAKEGAINGAVEGFMWSSIFALGSAFKSCFAKGTLVLTEDGHKKIEDIQEGDRVWAYNEYTGKNDFKPALVLFRNKTEKWCNVSVKTDSQTEEITSTPGHKYYLTENTDYRNPYEQQEHAGYEELSVNWVSAKDLRIGDKVLLSNGKYGIVEKVETKHLDSPETTYNFEVEDYHTYYVGENGICVHNVCGKAAFKAAKRSEGIPLSQQPDKISRVKMLGENGKMYKARLYEFGDKFVRHDLGGHMFQDGATIMRHFNAGKIINERFIGNGLHFWY